MIAVAVIAAGASSGAVACWLFRVQEEVVEARAYTDGEIYESRCQIDVEVFEVRVDMH